MRVLTLDPDYGDRADAVRRVQFRPDGLAFVAAVGTAGFVETLCWWDLAADARSRIEWTGAGSGGLAAYADPAISPDLSTFAQHEHDEDDASETVRVSQLGPDGGTLSAAFGEGDDLAVRCLGFTPDGGTLLAGVTRSDGSQEVGRWDVARLFAGGVQAATVAADEPIDLGVAVPTCLACSADGSRLAVGTRSETVMVFDLDSGEPLRLLRRKPFGKKPQKVTGLGFAPDGRRLLVRIGGTVSVWDAAVGKPVADLTRPARVTDAAWSPDGRTVLGASGDGTVTAWDADTFAERHRFDWKLGGLTAVAVAPDGLTAAAGGERGSVVVWDVEH